MGSSWCQGHSLVYVGFQQKKDEQKKSDAAAAAAGEETREGAPVPSEAELLAAASFLPQAIDRQPAEEEPALRVVPDEDTPGCVG